jgi:hypothetical protein
MLPQLGGTGNAAQCVSFALRQHVLPQCGPHFAMAKASGCGVGLGVVAERRGRMVTVRPYSAVTIRDNSKPLHDTLVNNSRITTCALHQFNTKRRSRSANTSEEDFKTSSRKTNDEASNGVERCVPAHS